jgi:hypothetical protein
MQLLQLLQLINKEVILALFEKATIVMNQKEACALLLMKFYLNNNILT